MATTKIPDARDVPAAWFAVMEVARREGDKRRAQEARRNLKRLGVTVTYARKAKGGDDAK